jgi:hypothetical protein
LEAVLAVIKMKFWIKTDKRLEKSALIHDFGGSQAPFGFFLTH